MAGRGRGMVLPAWMTAKKAGDSVVKESGSIPGGLQDGKSQQQQNGQPPVPQSYGAPPQSYGAPPPQQPARGGGYNGGHNRYQGRDHQRQHGGHRGGGRDRRRSRSRHSHRQGGRHGAHRGGNDRDYSPSRVAEILKRPRNRNFDVMPAAGEMVAPLYPPAGTMSAQAGSHRGGGVFSGFGQGPFQGGGEGAVAMGSNPQQTRHARRLYVGGVEHVSEEELKSFFQQSINAVLGREANAVMSVYLNLERRFAFVELNDVELTTACMDMDGISFRGAPLKIRRPNDFRPELLPPATNLPVLNLAAIGLERKNAATGLSNQVQEGPNKVFFGGVPYHLTDDAIKELLEAFGPLKALHVVRDPGQANSKGYGFCEYADPNHTDPACAGLNGFQLAERTLTVRRAYANNDGAAHGLPQAGLPANPAQLSGSDLLQMTTQLQQGGGGLGPVGMPFPAAPQTAPATRVLVLMNMVTPGELEDEAEYKDIVEDVQGECARFGKVLSVVIPRPQQGSVVPGVGKVFVEYALPEEAAKAREALEGRKFAERVVVCDYLEENKFARQDFD